MNYKTTSFYKKAETMNVNVDDQLSWKKKLNVLATIQTSGSVMCTKSCTYNIFLFLSWNMKYMFLQVHVRADFDLCIKKKKKNEKNPWNTKVEDKTDRIQKWEESPSPQSSIILWFTHPSFSLNNHSTI